MIWPVCATCSVAIKHLSAFGVPQEADFSPYAVVTVNMEFMNGVVGAFSYFPAGREVQKPAVGLRIFGPRARSIWKIPIAGW